MLTLLVLLNVNQERSRSIHAATITVNSRSDNGAGSLRQAIQDAAAGDTINFSVAGTIALTSGQLLATKNLTIAGPGAANLSVSGNASSRVFEIPSDITVTISGLLSATATHRCGRRCFAQRSQPDQ